MAEELKARWARTPLRALRPPHHTAGAQQRSALLACTHAPPPPQAKGNQLFATGDYAGAAAAFSDAIGLDASNHVLYSNRSAALVRGGGWAARARGRMGGRRKGLEAAPSRTPPPRSWLPSPRAHCMLQASMKDYDGALEDAKKVRARARCLQARSQPPGSWPSGMRLRGAPWRAHAMCCWCISCCCCIALPLRPPPAHQLPAAPRSAWRSSRTGARATAASPPRTLARPSTTKPSRQRRTVRGRARGSRGGTAVMWDAHMCMGARMHTVCARACVCHTHVSST